jgi:hypothetical protein
MKNLYSLFIALFFVNAALAQWHWQNSLPQGNSLSSIFFADANTGYAVGYNGTILTTEDGGGPVGINENKPVSNSLKLYPDPTCKDLTVETAEKGFLFIFNLNGVLLLRQEITKPTTTIDVSNLPNGLYVVKVVGEKEAFVCKFIKQ